MDISAEIAAIQAASQGSELRQPLVGALNKLNSGSLPDVTASDAGKILKVGANGWEVGEKSGYMPVPSAAKQITENGTYDVTDYASAFVNVSGSGGGVEGVIVGTAFPQDSIGVNGDVYIQNIPDNIIPVEYIGTSGNGEYISTGIYHNGKYDTYAKFIVQTSSGETDVFGARSSHGLDKAFSLFSEPFNNSMRLTYRKTLSNDVPFNIGYYTPTPPTQAEIFSKSIYNNSSYVYIINYNHNVLNSNYSSNISDCNFVSAYDICIFGINKNGTYTPSPQPVKINRLTFYDTGMIVADYVPCLDSNNVPCMYDMVSGQCKYNSGTGQFNYGNQITFEPSKYVKKSGTWSVIRNELL